ncbi:polyamine oxidase 1-like isoform X2 [Anneissia japonica]|uniref:polyamine oxidase 1-like isoform X2 n=1 Tax=Anneissia japonica TaxID=1529436 RepID=UPI0014258351|nr:polyamine oxidase 1-like isoform X2 [Anneissia japonica]
MNMYPVVLLLSILSCFVGSWSESVENSVSVLILGAGAAGLQAAQTLIDNGVDDFLILEGADYIGGRVHDVEFAGVRVEQGANWAQPGGGELEDLVRDLGMETHLTNWFSYVAYNSTGHNITDEAIEMFDVMDEKLRKAFAIAEELWEIGDTDMSIRSALRTVGWLPKTPLEHAIEWSYIDYEIADIPEVSSLKYHSTEIGEFIKRVGDEEKLLLVKDPRGFKYIFNATMQFLSDEYQRNKILLNKRITTIDQSSGDYVLVTCDDGTQYQANRAIVTFSLGVLQNQLVTFKPQLPGWKLRTLNRLEMASYSKIYVQFPVNFWGEREIIMRTSDQRGKYPFYMNLEAEGGSSGRGNSAYKFMLADKIM